MSGGGCDGILAEHLQVLLYMDEYQASQNLKAITSLVNLYLSGKIPDILFPFIGSAPVVPLKKKEVGAVRPIAVGGGVGALNYLGVVLVRVVLKKLLC